MASPALPGPGGAAFAQAGAGECWEQVWAVTGHDQAGNPTYGWRFVDTCDVNDDEPADGNPVACRHSTRGVVPCHDPVWGWWSNAEECYASLLDPQPPAGDPLWEGNAPAHGAVYQFRCPGDVLDAGTIAGAWTIRRGFLAERPPAPSVVQVARQAMASLELRAAEIGIAPSPDGTGLVGMPVWLWTTSTDETWGPVAVSVPGPGITVTAEGIATQIEWDMGDGQVVVCDGPGVPYEAHYGAAEPGCGASVRGAVVDSAGRPLPDHRNHHLARDVVGGAARQRSRG